ncbi:hypothetical protein SC1_00382 [Sphingopyxis sp. C-1]|nr:hypothetical protein SC1_00382 [Sphingopyxis sp. C-1]
MRVPDFLIKGAGPSHAVHLSLWHNNASEWRSKTQFSVAPFSAFFGHAGLDPTSLIATVTSGTPDRVRGDGEVMARSL